MKHRLKYTKFFCISLFSLMIAEESAAQKTPSHYVGLSGGQSHHGSGDVNGIIFTADYAKTFRNRCAWIFSLGTTIHDDEDPLLITFSNGERINSSIRSTTAAVQTTFGVSYNLVQHKGHEVFAGLSGLLRYQTTTNQDGYSILFPGATNLPFPVVSFDHRSSPRTFSVGGLGQIGYRYSLRNGITFGLLAGLQTDTNGDMLRHTALTLGKRF